MFQHHTKDMVWNLMTQETHKSTIAAESGGGHLRLS